MKSNFRFGTVASYRRHSYLSIQALLTILTIHGFDCKTFEASSSSFVSRYNVEERMCHVNIPTPDIDMCILKNYTGGQFEMTVDRIDLKSSSLCGCQLTHLQKDISLWIGLNNFSCPVSGCPWRLQVIADGCIKSQYCCTNKWKNQEVFSISNANQYSSIYLQISQLVDPAFDIGSVSITVRVENGSQLEEEGALMTCGINSDKTRNYDFVKCGQLPNLKLMPDYSKILSKRDTQTEFDICETASITANPMTFFFKGNAPLEAVNERFHCLAKLSMAEPQNVYKFTIENLSCDSVTCPWRLRIIVGKCIKYYICCSANWSPIEVQINDVTNERSFLQLNKFIHHADVDIDFRASVLIANNLGKPLVVEETIAGYNGIFYTENCPRQTYPKLFDEQIQIGGDAVGRVDDVDYCTTEHNNGNCSHICVPLHLTYYCSCPYGHRLHPDAKTCDELNECTIENGGCAHDCFNTLGSYECSCVAGFKLTEDRRQCTDIDECEMKVCNHICENTEGSFKCSCKEGYGFSLDAITCIDTDECREETQYADCKFRCVNVIGSFRCECPAGMQLKDDGKSCEDINECMLNNGGCAEVCINHETTYMCACSEGYEISMDKISCRDINECSLGVGCEHSCTNTVGSFHCTCFNGYRLNGTRCYDVDECLQSVGYCHHNCVNTIGSFYCKCRDGYFLDNKRNCKVENLCLSANGGCEKNCSFDKNSTHKQCFCEPGYILFNETHCKDVNECERADICDQYCENSVGSYSCHCEPGYTLISDKSCEDVDECSLPTHGGCSDICNNTYGSYECVCPPGYHLLPDSLTCFDDDECTEDQGEPNGGCEHECENLPGSYMCLCRTGYTVDSSNNVSCTDIEECQIANGSCDQNCVNIVGSFYCTCNIGFIVLPDKKSCDDVNECLNSEVCQHNCQNTHGSFYCFCYPGFVLAEDDSRTCVNQNECLTANGGCSHVCTDTVGSFTCTCRSGYTLEGYNRNCTDLDECEDHLCEQDCKNTIGSFECSCRDGYQLLPNRLDCTVIDWCIVVGVRECSHICMNRPDIKSYHCVCPAGYTLDKDFKTCIDEDECSLLDISCDHSCVNSIGSFECLCSKGYELSIDGYSCTDIDECCRNTSNCDMECANTAGAYYCRCKRGFQLAADMKTCYDKDECLRPNVCEQICVNSVGSFRCACQNGFELDGDYKRCRMTGIPRSSSSWDPEKAKPAFGQAKKTDTEDDEIFYLSEHEESTQSGSVVRIAGLAVLFCVLLVAVVVGVAVAAVRLRKHARMSIND